MYTSDIDIAKKSVYKTAFVYLLISVFCALFGAVYERFGHGVYSYYMIYAFAFPLVGGALLYFIFSFINTIYIPKKLPQGMYHSGIATLTVGSIVRGILDIYGTTNSLAVYYWLIGYLLIAASIVIYIIQMIKAVTKQKTGT